MKTANDYYTEMLDNPLTRCLANVPRGAKLREALRAMLPPAPDDQIRALPAVQRLRMLPVLRQVHIPLGRDVELGELLLDFIEDSYNARRPSPENYQKAMEVAATFPTTFPNDEIEMEATGGSLIGMSGTGKTRTMRRLLSLIPQAVHHPVDQNPLLPAISLTWVQVECPSNRSLRALASAIFEAIERAAKEKIPAAFKTGNESELIHNVAIVCSHYCVGLLVVDEIQHVLKAHDQPDKHLLNFLVTLSNVLKFPVVVIGTPIARKVIGGELRQARRMIGPEWTNLPRDNPSWKQFVGKLADYQFTKAVAAVGDIEPVLYEESQGLPGLAVMIYRISQRYAITLEADDPSYDRVTPEIITTVANKYFAMVQPMLDAIRSGDPYRMALYQDIRIDEDALEQELAQEAASRAKTIGLELFKEQKRALKRGKKILRQKVATQVEALQRAGLPVEPPARKLLDAFNQAKENGQDPAAAVAASS